MRRYYRETLASKGFDVFNVLLMFLFMLTIVFPFWNQLCISFSDVSTNPVSNITVLPLGFNTESYQKVFSDTRILKVSSVSLMRVIAGTLGTLLCTGLLAYITTIEWFSGRKLLRRAFLFTMYFSAGLIPTYLAYISIGLYNTFWVYIIPGMISAFNVMVLRTYMEDLPDELEESAQLDGAGYITIFIKIISPLCKPVYATVALFVAVWQWNSWFDAMLYNRMKTEYTTLQYELMKLLNSVTQQSGSANGNNTTAAAKQVTPVSVRSAATVVTMVPIICIYPFLQRYFVTGLTIGGVKG